MLETYVVQPPDQLCGPFVQRLKPPMADFELSDHLLCEEFRVRSDDDVTISVPVQVGQRGQESTVLGDVVRGGTDRTGQFLDDRPVTGLDSHTVPRGPRITACAAVNIRHDWVDHPAAPALGMLGFTTKYKIR